MLSRQGALVDAGHAHCAQEILEDWVAASMLTWTLESLATRLALETFRQEAKDRQADDQQADDAKRMRSLVKGYVKDVRIDRTMAGMSTQAGFSI